MFLAENEPLEFADLTVGSDCLSGRKHVAIVVVQERVLKSYSSYNYGQQYPCLLDAFQDPAVVDAGHRQRECRQVLVGAVVGVGNEERNVVVAETLNILIVTRISCLLVGLERSRCTLKSSMTVPPRCSIIERYSRLLKTSWPKLEAILV